MSDHEPEFQGDVRVELSNINLFEDGYTEAASQQVEAHILPKVAGVVFVVGAKP